MAGNELEIKVTADTAQAQKGIDGLEKSLKGLEKTGDSVTGAAKGMDNLATSAGKADKALPTASSAAGITAIGTAAEKTAVSAATATTSIKTLGDAGAVAGAKLKAGLGSGLGTAISGMTGIAQAEGAVVGTTLAESILTGLGGIAGGLIAVLAAAMAGAALLARRAGQDFADEYKKAVDAGLTVGQFQGFQAFAQMLDLQGKEIDKFAAKMGDLQEAFRKGKVPDNVTEALDKIHVSMKNLASTDVNVFAAEFQKLAEALQKLPQDVRSDFLKDLFKGMDPAGIAAINKAMLDFGGTAEKISKDLPALIAAQQTASEQNERMGKSWDEAAAGMKSAGDEFAKLIGFPTLWEAGVQVVIALTNTLAQAFRDLSSAIVMINQVKDAIVSLGQGLSGGGVEKFAESFKSLDAAFGGTPQKIVDWVQNIATVINDGVTTWGKALQGWGAIAAQAIADGAGACVAAAQGVVDAVTAVFTGMVEGIKAAFSSVLSYITGIFDKIKASIPSLPFGLGGGGSAAPQAVPQQVAPFAGQTLRSLMRAGPVLTPMGLIAGSSFAAPSVLAASAPTAQSGGTTANDIKNFTAAYYENTTAVKVNTQAKRENAEANKATADSGALSAAQLQSYANSLLDALDPMRVYNAEMAKYDQALKAGLISSDAFALAQQRAQKAMQGVSNAAGQANAGPMKEFQDGLKSWGDSVASSLADAIVNGEDLGDVFKGLVKQLAAMIIKTLILKPIMDAITGGLGGLFGGGVSALSAPVAASVTSASSFAAPAAATQTTGIIRATSTGGVASGVGGITTSRKIDNSVNNTLGDMTINMAGTPAVDADSEQAQKFGIRVRNLVQQEMVNQSRPGGLLRR